MARLLPQLWIALLLAACVSEREAVLDAARHGNTASRVAAIQKLAAGTWDARAEDVVVAALTDHSPLVRKTAAAALSGRGTSVAWPLVRRLKDGDLRVRVQVARSLHTLPAEDFVVTALVGALGDPAQMVRAEIVDGFLARGWKLEELLAWRSFSERLSALEQLTAHAATDQAQGLDTLGRLRAPQDFAFLYAALHHTDPFLVHVAARALAKGGEPEHLERLLEVGGPEPETLLATWLEATPEITPETFSRLRTRLGEAQLRQILQRRAAKLTCAWLGPDLPPELALLVPAGCELGAGLPFPVRWVYLRHHGAVTPELEKEALDRLDELDVEGLRQLAAEPRTRPAVLAWFTLQWQAWIADFEKWIPQGRWQQLELVGVDELAPEPAATATPVDRLLDTYRSRSNIVEETELFPPAFDVPRFAARLPALRELPEAREFLRAMLEVAPSPILAPALRTLASVTDRDAPLPEAVREVLSSEDPLVRAAAAALLARSGDVKTLLGLLGDADPSLQALVLEAFEERQDAAVVPELARLFSEGPTARMALALARLQAPGIRQELQSLLAEDTALAMAQDRAQLVLALSLSGPADEAFTTLLRRELWHPAPLVRCAALALLDAPTRDTFAKADPHWEVRTCAGRRSHPDPKRSPP